MFNVELPNGGGLTIPIPRAFQGFAYLLEGEAAFGRDGRRASPPQLVLLGPGDELAVTDAAPGTRFLLMAGEPYGEARIFNGPNVDEETARSRSLPFSVRRSCPKEGAVPYP